MTKLPRLGPLDIDKSLAYELNQIKDKDSGKKVLEIIHEDNINNGNNGNNIVKNENRDSNGKFLSSLKSLKRYNSTDKLINGVNGVNGVNVSEIGSMVSMGKDDRQGTQGTIYITGSDFRKSMSYNTKNNIDTKLLKEKLIEEIKKEAIQKFLENSEKTKLYCPYCDHCNSNNEDELIKFTNAIKESKNILSRGFDFIIDSGIMNDNGLDLFYINEKGENKKTEEVSNLSIQLI